MPKSKIAFCLARNLKRRREKLKLTLEEASARVGMDLRYYQMLESKKPYYVRIDTLERLAKALNTKASKLLED